MESKHASGIGIWPALWSLPGGVCAVVKLGVTGTRDGFSAEQLKFAVDWAKSHASEVQEFHYGDCVGVDSHMLWILLASEAKPHLFIYPALVSEKWRAKTITELGRIGYNGQITQYAPLAPLVRNGYIAEFCDYLLAFPGSGGGTWDCVRKAQAFQREGLIVYRDGQVTPL